MYHVAHSRLAFVPRPRDVASRHSAISRLSLQSMTITPSSIRDSRELHLFLHFTSGLRLEELRSLFTILKRIGVTLEEGIKGAHLLSLCFERSILKIQFNTTIFRPTSGAWMQGTCCNADIILYLSFHFSPLMMRF